MKITVEIPDDLLPSLKYWSHEYGVTPGELSGMVLSKRLREYSDFPVAGSANMTPPGKCRRLVTEATGIFKNNGENKK
jgi:hypothetical protein